MFLPSAHPAIEKINRISIIGIGVKETAPLYQYRSQVVAFINEAIKGVDEGLEEDLEVLLKWFDSKKSGKYWESAKKQMSPDAMAAWILENAAQEVENDGIQAVFEKVALNTVGTATESQLEDAIQVTESLDFQGSPKQIKWAKSIALENAEAIALSGISIPQIPIKASWWIDNRVDIRTSLKAIK